MKKQSKINQAMQDKINQAMKEFCIKFDTDPEFQRKFMEDFEKERIKSMKKLKPHFDAIKRSQMITAKDLSVVINATG